VRHRSSIGAGRLFNRHARFQGAVREVGEHGIGEPPHERDPRLAIARGRLRRLMRSRAVPRSNNARSLEKVAAIHHPAHPACPAFPALPSSRWDDRGDDGRIPLALIRLVGAAHPHDGRPAILPVRNERAQIVEAELRVNGVNVHLTVPVASAAKQLVMPFVVCGADERRAVTGSASVEM
jgi:hypothetical protein